MARLLNFIIVIACIAGCGVVAKDTLSQNTPASTIQIYALTDKGISISNNNGQTWTKNIQKNRSNNIVHSAFTTICLLDQGLLIGTEQGLSIATKNIDNYTTALEEQHINQIIEKGNYIATDKGLYSISKNYTYTCLATGNITQAIISPDLAYMAIDKTLYITTKNKTTWKKYYTYPQNIKNIAVRDKDVFVLTQEALYQNTTKNITIAGNEFRTMSIDAKRTLWVSNAQGLHKSSDKGLTWITFDAPELKNTTIDTITAEGLNIYLGSPTGLIHSANGGESWRIYRKQQGLLSGKILQIAI